MEEDTSLVWRKTLYLGSLNVAKTEFMVISSRQKLHSLNDKTINVNVEEGVKINQTDHSKDSRFKIQDFFILHYLYH